MGTRNANRTDEQFFENRAQVLAQLARDYRDGGSCVGQACTEEQYQAYVAALQYEVASYTAALYEADDDDVIQAQGVGRPFYFKHALGEQLGVRARRFGAVDPSAEATAELHAAIAFTVAVTPEVVAMVGAPLAVRAPSGEVQISARPAPPRRGFRRGAPRVPPPADYREVFFAAHPELRGEVVVHHAIEQQVLMRYPGRFTRAEVDALGNLRGIPTTANSELHLAHIRRAWNEFYRANPNATREQILQQVADIDARIGASLKPPR